MKRTNLVRRLSVKNTMSALLLAAGMLTQAGTGAAQTIELVDVANGTGGFGIINPPAAHGSAILVSPAGDFNGDGLGDSLVVREESGGAWRGYVLFGRTTTTPVALSAIAAGNNTEGIRLATLMPESSWKRLEGSAVGDINADGFADLALGAPGFYHATPNTSGRVYVVFGGPNPTNLDLSTLATGTSPRGFCINAEAGIMGLGNSVGGGGDINGDGMADILIGATQNNIANRAQAFVVFGKSTPGNIGLSDFVAGTSSHGFPILYEKWDALAGFDVSNAGDVNGDGLGDLIVGAPTFSVSAFTKDGRAYVIFGKTDTAPTELSAIASGSSGAGFALIGRSNSWVGFSVSGAGDVNGDGFSDVVVGAPNRFSAFTQTYTPIPSDPGRAYVVFGKSTGANVEMSSIAAGTSPEGFVIEANAPGSGAGYSVSGTGDLNGDGFADVMVGAPGALGGGGSAGRGRTALVLGRSSTAPVAFSEMIAYPPSGNGFLMNGQYLESASGLSVAGAGDIDGNGAPDLMLRAPAPSNVLVCAVLDPLAMAPTSTYRAQVAAGDPDRQAIGVHRYGDDETVYPDSRLWIDFEGGAGPGLAASSEVVATITRTKAGLGADPAQIADVYWSLSTNRTGYSAARVTVRYTNAEIAGLVEGHLRLLTAPTTAGPFTVATDAALNPARNEASGTVASLPAVFALGDVTGPVPTITRLLGDPTANQNPTWSVTFDEPVGAQFTTDDIAPAGSLASAVSIESITGTSPTFTVKLVADGESLDGTLGFDIVGGAVADAFGTASVPASAPSYTIAEVGAGVVPGDIDRDGQATVADVTALANHIVNGTPLP